MFLFWSRATGYPQLLIDRIIGNDNDSIDHMTSYYYSIVTVVVYLESFARYNQD